MFSLFHHSYNYRYPIDIIMIINHMKSYVIFLFHQKLSFYKLFEILQ